MKITVCAKCGSQDLERLAWVTLRSKQMTEFVDAGDFPNLMSQITDFKINYCNNCGDRCDVVELQYMEKYGMAYRIAQEAGNKPWIAYYPMMKDERVSIEDGEVEVDLYHAFTHHEREEFFKEMIEQFPSQKVEVLQIFAPYIDTVKEFVTAATDRMIDMIFQESHQEFKTKSGDIEPMQAVSLDEIKEKLVDLVTEQVKQNM